MLQRITFLAFIIAVISCVTLGIQRSEDQSPPRALGNNQCVNCHARSTLPLSISSRYLDWHFSAHRAGGVGCNACHGGDATARDAQRAHKGLARSLQRESRISSQNLPETCGTCHKAVVSSFVESVHYQKLKSSGLGPSCNTCHAHMASSVAMFPADAATYCGLCHNSVNGILPPRPDIPLNARKVMESIGRARYGIKLAEELLKEAQDRKLDVGEQIEDMRLLRQLFSEAKIGWHSFTLEGTGVKAEKAFDESLKIRDALMKKLGRS